MTNLMGKQKRIIGILPAMLLLLVTVYKCVNKDYRDNESLFDKESFMKKGYTQDEISLFGDIAFRTKENVIRKWETDILVEIKNREALTPRDIDDVDSCIRILAPLVYPLKMKRVEKNGNLFVYRKVDSLPGTKGCGIGIAIFNKVSKHHNIEQASIYEIKYLSGADILLHEFEHAIGLSHPQGKHAYYMNIYGHQNPYRFKSREENDSILDLRFPISEQEKQAIRMLYSSDFKSGLKRDVFMKRMDTGHDKKQEGQKCF